MQRFWTTDGNRKWTRQDIGLSQIFKLIVSTNVKRDLTI